MSVQDFVVAHCKATRPELHTKHTTLGNKMQRAVSLYNVCEEFGDNVVEKALEDANGFIDDLLFLVSAEPLRLPRPAKKAGGAQGNKYGGNLALVCWWVTDRCCPETMEPVDDDEPDEENKPGKHKILLLDEVRKLIYWRFVLNQTDLPGEGAGRGTERRAERDGGHWRTKGKRIDWEKVGALENQAIGRR